MRKQLLKGRRATIVAIALIILAVYLFKRSFVYHSDDNRIEESDIPWDGFIQPFVIPQPLFIPESSITANSKQLENIGAEGLLGGAKKEGKVEGVTNLSKASKTENIDGAEGLESEERSKEHNLIRPARPFTSSSKTLVTMAYCEISPVYIENLHYFIQVAISEEDENVDYVLVVNGHNCKPCEVHAKRLDQLKNVRIIYRINSGFDFGAYSDILSLHLDDISLYGNFIFLNGGVRGPIVPYYNLARIHDWHQTFTSKLNDHVALVGPSISCELQIHVQSHFFALNQKGLAAAWNAGVFASNGTNIDQIIRHSELGLTDSIFGAGLTIDSIILQYQTKDWRSLYYDFEHEKGEDQCNLGKNPLREGSYGFDPMNTYSISPFEVMFSKRAGSVRKRCKKKSHKHGEERICDTDSIIDDASEFILESLGLVSYSNRRKRLII